MLLLGPYVALVRHTVPTQKKEAVVRIIYRKHHVLLLYIYIHLISPRASYSARCFVR